MVVDAKKEMMKRFGEKVKIYRTLAKLTQEQLAEKCDCSAQTISGTETGYSFPSSNILFSIAEVLNVPLAYLFNFGDDVNIHNNEKLSVFVKTFNNLNEAQQQVILKVMCELAKSNEEDANK